MIDVEMLDWVPFWALFPIIIVVILAAIEIGSVLGYREALRNPDRKKVKSGTVVGAGLGLLAFILAFTFGSTTSRIDALRQLVLAEANAIGTAYLRTDLLEQSHRTRARDLLHEYTRERYELVHKHEIDRFEEVRRHAQAMQGELWSVAMEAAWAHRPTPRSLSPLSTTFSTSIRSESPWALSSACPWRSGWYCSCSPS